MCVHVRLVNNCLSADWTLQEWIISTQACFYHLQGESLFKRKL